MHYLNSVLNNKYFKGCFVVFLWLLFFFMGWLTQERFIAFCCTLFIIFIYISCYRLCALLGSTYFNKTVKMFIIKNENVFIQIHRILLLLNTLKNPILFLCVYLDKLLYIVFKALRSTIIKEPVYTFICFLIDLSLFGIIKICLGFFYKLLVSFKMLSFYDLLIKRMYGLIFSILIFTHILFCIKAVLIQHGFKGVFILYFSIVILYIILDFISIVFRYNKALIEKKTNIIIVFIASILDFIMRHSKAFLSSHNLKSLREIATILPLFINFLNLSLIVIREDSMEQYQIDSVQPISLLFTIKKRDFKEPCLVNETQEEVIFVKLVYLKNRLNLIQYIDSLGLGDHFLEVTFLYVWLYYKYRYYYTVSLYRFRFHDIKDYPSLFLYKYLLELNTLKENAGINETPVSNLMDMFYYKYMLNKEKAKLAVALGSDHYLFLQLKLDALVKFDKERIKLLFYMIWDIEACLNIENYNYDNYWAFAIIDGIYYFTFNPQVYERVLLTYNVNEKKPNAFYDLDQNLEFFIHSLNYFITFDSFAKNEIWKQLKSNLVLFYISKELQVYYNDVYELNVLFSKMQLQRTNIFKEPGFSSKVLDVELFVQDSTVSYLKQIRQEWVCKGPIDLNDQLNLIVNIYANYRTHRSDQYNKI